MPCKLPPRLNMQCFQGFSLVETVIGIVVLAIAFTLFTRFLYPLSNQSAGQVHQIKAAELGQSLMNEILGKAFDENSDMAGGLVRCGENSISCTTSSALGPEESSRELYDDVDDYHGLNILASSLGSGDSLSESYLGYSLSVSVINDSDYDGNTTGDNNYTAKLITITVTTPQKGVFTFSVYKVNF